MHPRFPRLCLFLSDARGKTQGERKQGSKESRFPFLQTAIWWQHRRSTAGSLAARLQPLCGVFWCLGVCSFTENTMCCSKNNKHAQQLQSVLLVFFFFYWCPPHDRTECERLVSARIHTRMNNFTLIFLPCTDQWNGSLLVLRCWMSQPSEYFREIISHWYMSHKDITCVYC